MPRLEIEVRSGFGGADDLGMLTVVLRWNVLSHLVLPVGQVAVPVRVSALVARCELVKPNGTSTSLPTKFEQSRLYDSFGSTIEPITSWGFGTPK